MDNEKAETDTSSEMNEGEEQTSQNMSALEIQSPSVLLMELNSGQVLYEKDDWYRS